MIFSSQKWFCTCCGKEKYSQMPNALGRFWKVCSYECLEEIKWRETLSSLGKEYYQKNQSGEK